MKTFLGHIAGLTLGLYLPLVAGIVDSLALPVADLGAALLEEGVLDSGVDCVVGRTTLRSSVPVVTSSVRCQNINSQNISKSHFKYFENNPIRNINIPDYVQNSEL